MIYSKLLIIFLFLFLRINYNYANLESTVGPTSPSTEYTTSNSNGTTPTPKEGCELLLTCTDCVKNRNCAFCEKSNQCMYYDSKIRALPHCGDLGDLAYLTCLVSYKVLWIVLGSSVGAILLIISILCCYCCRRRKNSYDNWSEIENIRTDRSLASIDKRKKRQSKIDQIRKKYGLEDDKSYKYRKF